MASLCANSSPFITAAVEKREHAPEPSIPSFLFHSKKTKTKIPSQCGFLVLLALQENTGKIKTSHYLYLIFV